MGNIASITIRTHTPAMTALPSDSFVIDCDWLEATHPHFQQHYKSAGHYPVETHTSWMRSAINCCTNALRALAFKPSAVTMAATHNKNNNNYTEVSSDFSSDSRKSEEKTAPVCSAPTNTVAETTQNSVMTTKSLVAFNNNNNDVDDDDDFEDCVSYSTDATDSLSESEWESVCFAFCGGRDCEAPSCRANAPRSDSGTASDCSDSNKCVTDDDDSDSDEDDEDCLARAERLVRMASSTCPDFTVYLDDYLCPCGECPQYKLIAYEVQRYGTYASDAEKMSLTRILQAFSTYNEAVGYDCDMILTAEECLQVWAGDESKAFQSFVTLYDEVPHLCA